MQLKEHIGSALPGEEGTYTIVGLDVVSGLPIEMEITADTVYEAMKDNLSSICNAIKMILEKTPPELAKDIIHLILCLQKLTLSDPEVSPYLKVIMVENYNVTEASHLIPACDISEQISLASKEASGTGNMKFMLNGAVTLGTMDGANVEICNLVGKDNIYIFGKSSQEVIQLYETSGYHSDQYYDNDPLIQNLVDFIISKEMIRIGDPENLCRLYKDLISKDWFMTLLDLKEYIAVKKNVMADYEDRMNWAGKMLINTAKAGYFSSDRTIAEYNRDIWKL